MCPTSRSGRISTCTSYQKDISGVLDGFVIFWNVKRT